MLIAAEDGARVERGVFQAASILSATKGHLPRHVFIFFSGNDLCADGAEGMTSGAEYGSRLSQTVADLASKGSPDPSTGSDIWLVDPLSLLQLIANRDLLSKKVMAHQRQLTCGELYSWQGSLTERMSSEFPFIPQSPSDLCPNLFMGARQSTQLQMAMTNRLLEYRRQIGKVAEQYSRKPAANTRVHQVRSVDEWLVSPEGLANDCFHLSLAGHLSLAKAVLKGAESHPSLM